MKTIFKTLLFVAVALSSATMYAQSDFDELYSKADQARIDVNNLIYNGPVKPAWKNDDTFLFKNKEKGGDKYYQVDVARGTKVSATQAEYDAVANQGRPYYDPSDESYFSMNRERPQISPDGKLQAYIKDNNIWVSEAPAEQPAQGPGMGPGPRGRQQMSYPQNGKQLSYDGTDAYPYDRIMWSPDSKKIAATRKQDLKERQIMLRESRPDSQVQPKYRMLDYAKPGDALPQMEIALFDVESGAIKVNNAPFQNQYFLQLGSWDPESRWFTFEYNQRGHQVYQLVAVDAKSGKTRILADEDTAKYGYKFIYYYDIYRYYYNDGKKILWTSERDGYRHLYAIDPITCRNTQLTKGQFNVREIYQVNEEKGYILLSVNGLNADKGEDPYNKHVCRLYLTNGELVDLTSENANHTPSFSKDFTYFVDNYSRPDLPNVAVVRSSKDGQVKTKIQEMDITELLKTGFTIPEVFKAKGRDGKTDIWGTIYRPRKFNNLKKYPVIEYIYAGPHDSHVEKDFMTVGPRNLTLCELGFVVVCIDGMGTDNRSREFQDVCWQNLKDGGFPDRILWMQAAAKKYKNLDISNVGIYGYSAGGQNTLSALLFHPDFYKVGVSLCGCHDNRMDKIWWNEQWMGYPIGPWYSESSNVDNASKLEGKLFIINGEIDDNVDPASSLQVVHELIKADKDFRQLHIPGRSHNLGETWVTKQMFKYFYENCK